MRFWVHGRGIDEVETLGWLKQPLRDLKDWAGMQYDNLMEQYLMDRIDENVQDASSSGRSDAPLGVQQQQETGWFGGLFGALKPNVQGSPRGGSSSGKRALPPAGTYTSGEARADFVKVRCCLADAAFSGHSRFSLQDPKTDVYRLLTLTVDIPSARSAAQRAVVFWADSADVSQEGLLEGNKTRLSW